MNKKCIKEKTVYEFDVDSFEKEQAYKIIISEGNGFCETYIGLLVSVDKAILSFVVAGSYYPGSRVMACRGDYGVLPIHIDDYMRGNISILKLGVVENE